MPQRSAVRRLPAGTRQALNRKLIDGGFAGYDDLADWLASQGWEISRSAVHRYGQQLEKRIEQVRSATEQAEALMEASGGDGAASMAGASLLLVQEKMYQALLDADDGDVPTLAKSLRAVAEASRASVSVAAVRKEALREAAAAAVDAAEKAAEKAGASLPAEALAAIRRDVYGLADAA